MFLWRTGENYPIIITKYISSVPLGTYCKIDFLKSQPVYHVAFMGYSKTCVRQPPLKLTLVVDVERWLSYKGTYHVILLAKLHDMYLYKTDNFFHINHYLKSVSKVALLHRFTVLYSLCHRMKDVWSLMDSCHKRVSHLVASVPFKLFN